MPSPFPGMDPYLEGEMWEEFHETLASAIRAQLLPALRPKYVALLEKRYVLNRSFLTILGIETITRPIYPDVHVSRPADGPLVGMSAAGRAGGVRVMTPTAEVISPMGEEVPVLGVEIRDVANRRLVTAIEILSPVNKLGESARDYDDRRQALLKTQTHLLEIDLIRRGQRIVVEGALPPAPYYIYLSRFQSRPITAVWAVQLHEPLPVVPVPLLPPDADVALDLQAAVDACFELVGYEQLLDYSQPPLPPLTAEEAAWVRERLGGGTGASKTG